MKLIRVFGIAAVMVGLGIAPAMAQQTPDVTAPGTQETKPDVARPKTQTVEQNQPPAAVKSAGHSDKSVAKVKTVKEKKAKAVYTGPTDIVVLEPTPMLDEEGKQQLDPDGKPMYNPPVHQQRDKKGHPVFDEKGKPVFQTAKDLGFDEHGKKIHPKKEKQPKKIPVSIARGTMTVDGWTGKARLNYEIADLKYIYMYAPGLGVTVVSNAPFPGAKEEKNAFDQKTLTVTVEGHSLQLYSEKVLLGKKPESAWVLVDKSYSLPSKFPVVGYGTLRKSPYAWPGAKAVAVSTGPVVPPPLPVDMQPVLALKPCPANVVAVNGKQPMVGNVPCKPVTAVPGAVAVKMPTSTPASKSVVK